MKLEEQVVSLELAKRLKELCVKQDSLFWWYACSENLICARPNYIEYGSHYVAERDLYSAFTVAELGEILPTQIKRNQLPFEWEGYRLCSERYATRETPWVACYRHSLGNVHSDQWANTAADALANMLIHLIENGLVTPAHLSQM